MARAERGMSFDEVPGPDEGGLPGGSKALTSMQALTSAQALTRAA